VGGQAELLDTFDADDAAVVDDDVNGPEAEGLDVLLDDLGPVLGIGVTGLGLAGLRSGTSL
jgi:hypothetical protein